MLWACELKEFKLSRELSLLCAPPPPPLPSACPPLRWGCSSRSAYQLSPNPLSRMLLSFRLDVSCRAFFADTNTQMSKQAFTIQPSHPHLRIGVIGVSVCVCVFLRGVVVGGGHNLLSRTVNTHYTVYLNQYMLQLNWNDAIVFCSLDSMSKQTPPCLAYPDGYVYSTETIAREYRSHFNQHSWRQASTCHPLFRSTIHRPLPDKKSPQMKAILCHRTRIVTAKHTTQRHNYYY